MLSSFVAALDQWQADRASIFIGWVSVAATVFVAFTMVSGVRYYAFKDINIRRRVPFRYVAVFFLSAAALNALADTVMEVLLLTLSVYLFSGYAYAVWKFIVRRRDSSPEGK